MTEIIEIPLDPQIVKDREEWEATRYEREYAEVQEQRQQAYQQEADPIFFQAQRGKKTEKEWLAKIDEIDARYPYPVKEGKK
jgi:hypothetical protein